MHTSSLTPPELVQIVLIGTILATEVHLYGIATKVPDRYDRISGASVAPLTIHWVYQW